MASEFSSSTDTKEKIKSQQLDDQTNEKNFSLVPRSNYRIEIVKTSVG